MSAADDVAGLPGGGALAELAKKVDTSQPDAVRAIGKQWTTAAGKCGECDSAVTSSVAQLDGAWEGTSADGFVAYMGKFGKAGDSVKTALTNAAKDVDNAATALETAKTSMNSLCENLLSEVRRWQQQNPTAPRDQYEGVAYGMVQEVVPEAQKVISTAETALSGALDSLSGAAGAVNPKFSSLPDPNTQAFTPAKGKLIDWKATPQDDKTSKQSSGPGPGGPGGPGPGGPGPGGPGPGPGPGGLGPSGGPPSGPPPPGNVQDWIQQAIKILEAQGIPADKLSAQDIWTIIQHESGGNPNAINNWDSNAQAGHPSKGLMQTIDSTFNSYKLPGHDNIYNPVDNVIAGVRYALSRYGSIENVPGIKAVHSGGAYVGY